MAESKCPLPTQDIKTNLANRAKAIDVAHYGPANPKEPNEEYWTAKAKIFGGSVKEAKTMRCGNCAGFNQTTKLTNCISKGIGSDAQEVEQAGDLGYCEIFDFKCASLRTCDAWIVGGPITDKTNFEQLKADLIALKEQGATLLYDPSQKRDEAGKWTSGGFVSSVESPNEISQRIISRIQKENPEIDIEDGKFKKAVESLGENLKDAKIKTKYGNLTPKQISNWIKSEDGQKLIGAVDKTLKVAGAGAIGALKGIRNDQADILTNAIFAPQVLPFIATRSAIHGIISNATREYQSIKKGQEIKSAVEKQVGVKPMEASINPTELQEDINIADVADYLTDVLRVSILKYLKKKKEFQVVTFYDPSQPRDESGKWSKATSVLSDMAKKGWENIGGPFFSKQYSEGEVTAELKPSFDDTLRISHIETKDESRGKGIASKALKEITDSADKIGAKITATVSPTGTGGLSKSKLHEWYKKNGFVRKPYPMEPEKKSDVIEREPKKNNFSSDKTEFYDPSQARDESGKWTGGGGLGGEILVSPNIKENMNYEEAKKMIDSPEHARAVSIAKDAIKKQDMDGKVESGVGDWEDGAENSIKIDVNGVKDFDQLKYTASKLGASLNQKAVVAFQKKKDGPDILHKISADRPMDEVRKILSENGISFRTMVGDRAKTSVTILDQGSQLTANVAKFLGAINGKSEAVRGVGEFIGGDTRIAGKKAYKSIIDNYERSFPNRVRLGVQRRGGRNYYRSYQAIDFYDPSQKRDDSGKWTGSGGSSGTTPTPKWAQDNPAEASKKTGQSTVLYHGTSADVLKDIRKDGLKPSKSGVWGGGKVYSTDSLDLAMEYGVLRSGSAPKIGGKQLIGIISVLADGFKSVADNIPTTKAQKMGKTGLNAVSKIFTKDGVVPPTAIKLMQIFEVDTIRKYVYENGPKPKPLATKQLADGSKLIYVPIVIQLPDDGSEGFQFDEEVAIESFVFQYNGKVIEFYDPNQPRDENGRWSGKGGGGGKGKVKGKSTKANKESETSTTSDEIDQMVQKLKAEPKAKMAMDKMAKLQKEVAKAEGSENAPVTHWSLRDPKRYIQKKDLIETFNSPTPEHEKWKQAVIDSELNPKAQSTNPIAVILMGSPASGKTTTGRPFAEKILNGKETTKIDPDSVKGKSKGFEGWNAGAFHEESALISEKVVFPRAVGNNHNLLIDITGKNSNKVAEMARTLKSVGYTIGLVHVDVDDKVALDRASKRFNKPNGRYVPYDYIRGSAEQARKTWTKLTSEGIADIGYSIDGNADRSQGTAPVKATHGNLFD
jgi:predicted GNAT family acetyltransferase/adenylate kinase family enzyme